MFIMIISRMFNKKNENPFLKCPNFAHDFTPTTQAFRVLWIFLPHLRHLAAPALPPWWSTYSHFSQKKSRRKDSHHWHLPKKAPQKLMSSREAIKSQLMAPRCVKLSSGSTATRKHLFLGTPNIGFTPVGSKPWALPTWPPQSAVVFWIPKKLREIWVNWWIRIRPHFKKRLKIVSPKYH